QTLLIGRRLLGMGSSNHRLEGVDVIGKLLRIGRVHARTMAQNTPDCLSFCASESVCRRLFTQPISVGSSAPPAPVSSPSPPPAPAVAQCSTEPGCGQSAASRMPPSPNAWRRDKGLSHPTKRS